MDGTSQLTINPATLTITANNDSKTYGTLKTFSGTAFTETGLVTANGDTITGVTETSTGAPVSATVGTYNIVPSAAVGTGLGNYTIGYVNGTLTVNPATLTITANNDSKTYGTLKTFGGTAFTETGLVTANGDTITGVTETSTGAPASATVGTYNIVSSAATGNRLSNYIIGYVNGRLTVTPATPTISWSNPAPITCFTPLSGTQLDAAAGWSVGGSAMTVGGTFAYTPPSGTLLPTGTHTLSAKFTPCDSTDYTTSTATVQIVVLAPASRSSARSSTASGATAPMTRSRSTRSATATRAAPASRSRPRSTASIPRPRIASPSPPLMSSCKAAMRTSSSPTA